MVHGVFLLFFFLTVDGLATSTGSLHNHSFGNTVLSKISLAFPPACLRSCPQTPLFCFVTSPFHVFDMSVVSCDIVDWAPPQGCVKGQGHRLEH